MCKPKRKPGRHRKDLCEWWKDRLDEITGAKGDIKAKELYDQLPQQLRDLIKNFKAIQRGYWSVFKLAIHAYYLDIYTTIMSKHKEKFGSICYVDTFSGPGILQLRESNNFVFGSPLLAILLPSKPFDKYVFIDNSENVIKILKFCLNFLNSKGKVGANSYRLLHRDMNEVDYSVELENCGHSLVFIDPEGLEPKWSTIKNLSDLSCDLIINYMDSGVRRVFGKKGEETIKLDDFFGSSEWQNISDPEKLFSFYCKKLEQLNRELRFITVRGLGSFQYRIIIAVRRAYKDKNREWLKAIDSLRNRVEKTSESLFDSILRQYFGKQASLNDF